MSERKPFADKMPSQPGSQYSREVGIVLLNHVGSNSRQDTGRDAQFLADRFGVIAVAVDRPTGHGWPRDVEFAQRLRSSTPVKEMFALAAQVDRILDKWQVKRAIVVGRSAGGLGALELAHTEGISGTTLVYAAEPVGCYYVSDDAGKKRYVEYMKAQKKKMAEDAKWKPRVLIHPEQDWKLLPRHQQVSRAVSMATQFSNDKYYNLGHWSQNWVADHAAMLAFSGIPTHLDFAEDSLVLPTDEVERKAYLHGLASAEEVPRTMHASFDNRDFFAQRIQHATELHTDLRFITT